MNGIGSGTNLYQKPMPKQVKEGGINSTFDFRGVAATCMLSARGDR